MNETNWNLNNLYLSFDAESFHNDMDTLNVKIDAIQKWASENLNTEENPVQKLEYYISFQNSMGELSSKLYEFAQLSLSTDAFNEKALKTLDILDDIFSETTATDVSFQKWVCTLKNIDNIISSSPLLQSHSFFILETIKHGKYLMSDKEEVLLAKMKNTGSSSWSKLQENLTSTLMVTLNINSEEMSLPLAEVRNMAYSGDAVVRKTAYESELKAYEKIVYTSSSCLNSIKGEVLTVSNLRGYSSPLDMTLLHSRMDSETLAVMISEMKKSLPVFEQYFIKKAEILGYNNGLPFYDLFAPINHINMNYTYNEAKEFIKEHFYSFSEKLGDYASLAFQNRWIDVYPKEGKRGGAFCSNIHSIKESRILTNFTGSFNDVLTLAHELGHGYHGDCLKFQTYLNSDYPMPIAETASTFCETIVKSAALKKASIEEKQIILEADISDNAQVIVDILSRYLFEDEVFKQRKNGSLSPSELSEIMVNAQKQTYGKGLDTNFMHPYMWVCKPHYYDADYNYYNFPYAFGLLFAKGLYSQYLEKGKSFVIQYDKILSATGNTTLVQAAKSADIDIHSSSFWRNSLNIIEKDILNFCMI